MQLQLRLLFAMKLTLGNDYQLGIDFEAFYSILIENIKIISMIYFKNLELITKNINEHISFIIVVCYSNMHANLFILIFR